MSVYAWFKFINFFETKNNNIHFIGDAFFAFPPSLAQGASQSIEGAYELFRSIENNTERDFFKKRVNKIFKEDNSRIGIGLYNEKRKVYKGPNFISELNTNERRNIHLGIDIFIDQGTDLFAPIDGKIIILKNNKLAIAVANKPWITIAIIEELVKLSSQNGS